MYTKIELGKRRHLFGVRAQSINYSQYRKNYTLQLAFSYKYFSIFLVDASIIFEHTSNILNSQKDILVVHVL